MQLAVFKARPFVTGGGVERVSDSGDSVMVSPGLLELAGEFVDGSGRAGTGYEQATGCGCDTGKKEDELFHDGELHCEG